MTQDRTTTPGADAMSVWLEPETVAALGETQMTDTPNGLEQAIEAGFSTSDGAYGLFSKADIRALLAQNRRYAEALVKCRDKFNEYADLHAAKLTARGLSQTEICVIVKKTDLNRELAGMCDEALNPIGGSSNG